MTPATKPETFVAVDGTALAYRSHFAFLQRPLTSKRGDVTSAVFGFILSLRRILAQLEPDAVVVVFDPPGPTFRHEMYPEYKATRERMPEDLRAQLPLIHEYLDAAAIPRLSVDGFEADDVMATLAKRAAESGMVGRIVSNDKDLLQMVGEGIEVVTLGKASEPPRVMGPRAVREAYGVDPGQVVDFLTLTGDVSDNVPGVPGVGKKTAARLLGEYGSLEGLMEAAPGLKKGKLRENLLGAKETVLVSRSLVVLRTDVPVGDPESFRPGKPDPAQLNALFDELDFQSFKTEEAVAAPSDVSGYGQVKGVAELERIVAGIREAGRFAFAAQTTDRDPLRTELVGIALGSGDGSAWYVPIAHEGAENLPWEEVRRALKPLFEDPGVVKWGHDVKFDRVLLRRRGVDVRGIDFDTMLASYVLDPSRRNHGLAVQARDRLGVEAISRESVTGSGRTRVPLSRAPLDEVAKYAAETAELAFRLRGEVEPELHAAGLAGILDDVELPLLEVLARMEETGVRLDSEHLAHLSKRMEAEIADLERRAWEAAGEPFNLASPKQVAEMLFGKLGLRSRRRTKTGHSTDADVLAALSGEHEVPGLVLRHREVSKLKSTYVDALPAMVHPETGRIHTRYNQAVAATGRLSSADPNLQNVPVRTEEGRQIRRAFVPAREGWLLVSCDYSQIELRVLAHMASDETLRAAFREDRDVHRATAAQVFDVAEESVTPEQRGQAKTINYAVIYGMGPVNLGRSLGISTREASRFIDSYFERHPGVAEFIDRTQEAARENLFVETLLGRRRPVPEIASRDHRTRAFGERIAVNTPIQGTAADILKLAMIRVQEALDRTELRSRMILTVHDELVLDCPGEEREEVCDLVRSRMEGAMELAVPLRADAGWGANWSEAH